MGKRESDPAPVAAQADRRLVGLPTRARGLLRGRKWEHFPTQQATSLRTKHSYWARQTPQVPDTKVVAGWNGKGRIIRCRDVHRRQPGALQNSNHWAAVSTRHKPEDADMLRGLDRRVEGQLEPKKWLAGWLVAPV